MTIILAALSDEQTALVVDLEHPQLMLTALQKMYRHVCNTTVGTLKREYMALYINVCVCGGEGRAAAHPTHTADAGRSGVLQGLTERRRKTRETSFKVWVPDWTGYVGLLETCPTFEELLIKVVS
ncbi:hypothetical protein PR003_g9896 [Phytophthora rubi]|uniref:Uncharacterized protein n=1 Tax=Phytophthora rubi TaxID=129364 RepID=A0A6A4FLN6_9STRA|nr:hypothetical protein PR003_g9896 [Phytophthora rubi]